MSYDLGPASLGDIKKQVADFDFRRLDERFDSFTPSAVLIPLFIKDGELFVMLTRRTETVKHHKGQISFPGGRLDPGESLVECALRETEEEIGVPTGDVDIYGRLDETPVITNYKISPFVGRIPYPFDFVISEEEIDKILYVPVRKILNPEVHEMHVREWMGYQYTMHSFDVGEDIIWGATGRILTQFLRVAFGYVPPQCAEWEASQPDQSHLDPYRSSK